MAVDRVEVRSDTAVRSKRGIEVTDELMSVEVEIDPVRGAAPLSATEHLAIESARFGDVPYLDGHMKRPESHAFSVEGAKAPT
jgi:hypothetical protein